MARWGHPWSSIIRRCSSCVLGDEWRIRGWVRGKEVGSPGMTGPHRWFLVCKAGVSVTEWKGPRPWNLQKDRLFFQGNKDMQGL